MQWHKILHAQSKKRGEESLPWIQNQILWDMLEFNNKHLQTLLIQYSIWRIWINPTLPSCFPTRSLGKQSSAGGGPTKSWHFSKFEGHARWPRKCHSRKCKNRHLQVRGSILASEKHIGTTGLFCTPNRGNTLGSSPTGLKRLVENLDFYSSPF